ncbi:MAG: hypothetical protein NT139_00015 [Candidatus Woesearchaeota archaeon]|nr:hypothetical protein [Candidatus Woesearchaeota archaeon]
MVTKETTVKISQWLLDEIEKFINTNKRNKTNYPSKRNFVDRAIIKQLEDEGINLKEK